MRIGHGYDVHRLKEGRRLILGGVEITYSLGLDGHSDADVLCHAITDAILGAAKMGDIGLLFPDTDMSFKDADSVELLKKAVKAVNDKGYRVLNVDATIIAQKPKLRPYIDKMCENIAKACNISAEDVNVKATTEEGLGFSGEGLGMAAHAVCLIE
ncbi:MAG: 2-C-methyl-D-erythritol 2,4-cyclodiphosphate synthase [Clostridia bacterium]|nr:2-C-methyl-D-erythritol 2,4-cyclodiphosphate synthase [Clostridia bacterium]